jgi:hypothetical protein
MIKERIGIATLGLCIMLLASCISVSAQSIDETITDSVNDVVGFDYASENMEITTENEYVEVENIDITEVVFTLDGTSAVITLEVAGEIEDRGSIEDTIFGAGLTDPTLSGLNIDTIEYSLTVLTDLDSYQLSYVNNECKISSSDGIENITDFTVDGALLTIPFTLTSSDETYTEGNVSALISYMRVKIEDILTATEDEFYDGFVWLSDTAPNILDGVFASATNLALVNKPVQFNASLIDPFTSGVPPYSWEWDFGDGDTATTQNPTHTYTEAKNYTYTVTVTDSQGASTDDSGIISITSGDDDDNGTPGFELIAFLISMIAVIILIRRR